MFCVITQCVKLQLLPPILRCQNFSHSEKLLLRQSRSNEWRCAIEHLSSTAAEDMMEKRRQRTETKIYMPNYNIIQYNTIKLIFDVALLPYACQAQQCTFTPRRLRYNCNAEHCRRGTCSRSLRGGL